MNDRAQLDRWLLRNAPPGPNSTREERTEYFERMPAAVKSEWHIRKAALDCLAPEYNASTVTRAQKRMGRVDAMPPDIRKLVYEYGLELVQEFINHGVKTAKSIHHLIMATRNERPDGTNFFRPNVKVNAKQNPVRDEEEYYSIPRL